MAFSTSRDRLIAGVAVVWCLVASALFAQSVPLDRLVSRVEASQDAFLRGDYNTYLRFQLGWHNTTPKLKKEQLEWHQKNGRRVRVRSVRLKAIRIDGTVAEVTSSATGRIRSGLLWQEGSEDYVIYWVCRDDEWYTVPARPPDFDPARATSVPVTGTAK